MNAYGVDDQNKRSKLFEALELEGHPLHPNSAELLDRYILKMDCDRVGMLVMLISAAKSRYAAKATPRQPMSAVINTSDQNAPAG